MARAKQEEASVRDLMAAGAVVRADGQRRTLLDLLGNPAVTADIVERLFPWVGELAPRVRANLEVEGVYAGYLPRQQADIRAFRREEAVTIGEDIDFAEIGGLSAELREKLKTARPASLGAAARVPGMTPAGLAALMAHLRRWGPGDGGLSKGGVSRETLL
jgi:tRNA uridine 5-carboxymethylaminomethyl modification enzyme